MIGKKIAHYEVSARLGAGGMGEVYLAKDTTLGREVALKLLPAEMSADENARARLLNEARTASSLNHPHICTIFEVGEAEGRAYIAMEHVQGEALAAKIPEDGLAVEAVLRYGTQVADALAHAHERGVIHRDLKTSNVMITPDGRAKVLDFGLAKQLGDEDLAEVTRSGKALTQAGTVVGTLHAIAPEVLTGHAADERSDVWALGVLLYEMAAGALPFEGKTGFELTSHILREPPRTLPEKVTAGLRAVIQRCLTKELGERYQRASEVRAALEAIGSDARILASSGAKAVVVPTKVIFYDHPSANKEANEYFDRGMFFIGPQFRLEQAQQMFARAVELDPKFADARATLALTFILQVHMGSSNDSALIYRAEQESRRALEDDPNSSTAHSIMGVAYLHLNRREQARNEFEEGHRLNQNILSHRVWVAIDAIYSGDYPKAELITRRLAEEDPTLFPARYYLAETLREQGSLAEARREIDKVLMQHNQNLHGILTQFRIHLDQGDLTAARAVLSGAPSSERSNYRSRLLRALLFASEGKRAEASRTMDAATLKYAEIALFAAANVAEFYSLQGQTEKALDWLDRAVRLGDERGEWFQRDPLLENVRELPRFKQIIESIAYRRAQRKNPARS